MTSFAPAFASAAVSSACAATSSTFHRPFLPPLPSLPLPVPATLPTVEPSPTSIPIRTPLHVVPLMHRTSSGNSAARSSRAPRNPNYTNGPQNNVRRKQQSTPEQNGSLANLHELTERIADLLHVGSIHNSPMHCPKDAPLGYLSANSHVAVLFGKHLIRDQISVEFAKRIVTFIKQLISGALKPDVICFTGGKGLEDQAAISEAAAGYAFFRAICEEICFDVSRFDFILEERSRNTKENMRFVIDELRRRSGSQAISACHFTLVSSDYHLIRIQEIHRLSPRQSILFPLEVSNATWNCIFAAYPFCVSRDAATAFLGRAIVLANDLGILQVNLNGAIDDREFVSRENLHRLNETFAKIREMYRVIDARVAAPGGFCTNMRTHAEMLELAIHDIREVQTLLNPLLEVGASIPREHLEQARKLLKVSTARMRSTMDPDRVLLVHDRLAIIDDLMQFRIEEKRNQAGDVDNSSVHSVDETPLLLEKQTNIPENNFSELEQVSTPTFDTTFTGSESNGSKMRRRVVSNEVTWHGSTNFEGNGKKIARDGPTLVIMDSSIPTTRSRPRRSGVPTNDGFGNVANNGRALTSTQQILGQTSIRNTTTSTPSRRRASSSPSSSASAAPSSATRKSRQTNTVSKKRKASTSRKVPAPSALGDMP